MSRTQVLSTNLDELQRLRTGTLTSIAQPDSAAFKANLHRQLTEDQLEQLMNLERPLTAQEAQLCDRLIARNNMRGVVLVIGVPLFFIIMIFILPVVPTPVLFFFQLLLPLAALLAITYLKKNDRMGQMRQQGDEEARAYYATYGADAAPTSIQLLRGTLHVSELGGGSRPHTVEIGGKQFNISQELWRWLRDRKGEFAAFYVNSPFHGDVLLSIQSADNLPPDEERLAKVIGVGVDGELIYEDDPIGRRNSPHTKPIG